MKKAVFVLFLLCFCFVAVLAAYSANMPDVQDSAENKIQPIFYQKEILGNEFAEPALKVRKKKKFFKQILPEVESSVAEKPAIERFSQKFISSRPAEPIKAEKRTVEEQPKPQRIFFEIKKRKPEKYYFIVDSGIQYSPNYAFYAMAKKAQRIAESKNSKIFYPMQYNCQDNAFGQIYCKQKFACIID